MAEQHEEPTHHQNNPEKRGSGSPIDVLPPLPPLIAAHHPPGPHRSYSEPVPMINQHHHTRQPPRTGNSSSTDDDEEVLVRVLDPSKLEENIPSFEDWKPGKQELAVMITMAVISLMVALDATILVSVLPTLAEDFGGTSTDAFWAGTSYLLTCAVCQPFIAALSDIFGRKEMLFASVLLFTLGTALCAPIAKGFAVFFAGRSVQGIGGGGIITMGQVIFADIVPLRQRPKYFAIVLAAWALGSVLGPLIGGLFVEHAIWRWCFYLNFPFCAMGLLLVPAFVKLTTKKTSLGSKLTRVDWLGGFLFIGGLTSFLVGMSWAGIQFEWRSVQTIVPMTVGGVSVLASIVWERYGAREPFLRASLFRSRSAIAAYGCALFQGLILFCALYYVPFYFTAVRFTSPTQSGLNIFPVTCLLLPGSIIISLMTSRLGRFRWSIWSGWVLATIGCGLLHYLRQDTKTAIWAVILAIFGIGHGMLLTSVNVGIQAISRVEDAGSAAAMYAFMRTLGMSLGVAIGGTVFQNVMVKRLGELGLPIEIAHNSEQFVRQMAAMDPKDPVRIGALDAYVAGFHGVYWTITGAGVAALICSLFIQRHSMDKILESKFVLRGAKVPPVMFTNAKPGQTVTAPAPVTAVVSNPHNDNNHHHGGRTAAPDTVATGRNSERLPRIFGSGGSGGGAAHSPVPSKPASTKSTGTDTDDNSNGKEAVVEEHHNNSNGTYDCAPSSSISTDNNNSNKNRACEQQQQQQLEKETHQQSQSQDGETSTDSEAARWEQAVAVTYCNEPDGQRYPVFMLAEDTSQTQTQTQTHGQEAAVNHHAQVSNNNNNNNVGPGGSGSGSGTSNRHSTVSTASLSSSSSASSADSAGSSRPSTSSSSSSSCGGVSDKENIENDPADLDSSSSSVSSSASGNAEVELPRTGILLVRQVEVVSIPRAELEAAREEERHAEIEVPSSSSSVRESGGKVRVMPTDFHGEQQQQQRQEQQQEKQQEQQEQQQEHWEQVPLQKTTSPAPEAGRTLSQSYEDAQSEVSGGEGEITVARPPGGVSKGVWDA
ncbi:major facilitator superfamily domain-containing protein [Sordaria sp. MPI-SDFR-AT-0083]|nr:major facilitator superfamily domain-containing protein [Sordaria sp. MPI-SDFR-AT-0083]